MKQVLSKNVETGDIQFEESIVIAPNDLERLIEKKIAESGGGGAGLIVVAKDIDLIADKEEEAIVSFHALIERSLFPEDFVTNPEKYNLVVNIVGESEDESTTTKVGYTANHFCYLIQPNGEIMMQCYDAADTDGTIKHMTSVSVDSEDNTKLAFYYEGRMNDSFLLPETGSKISVYLQKLA